MPNPDNNQSGVESTECIQETFHKHACALFRTTVLSVVPTVSTRYGLRTFSLLLWTSLGLGLGACGGDSSDTPVLTDTSDEEMDTDTDTETDTDTGIETYDPVDTRSFASFDDTLTLVHEIDLAATVPDWTHPVETDPSEVQVLLGSEARVLPPGSEWSAMSYTLGNGLGLEAGKDYLIEFSYPDDVSRSLFVINRGAETMRGFHTGEAIGDALGGYTNSNPESIDLPQSGTDSVWRQFFTLHDRYPGAEDLGRTQLPGDGFDVVIVSLSETQNPLSSGAAGRTLRLYEVTGDATLPLVMPPADLPHRHVFWREEMADAVIDANSDPATWGFDDRMDWYRNKLRLMKFLGVNTLSKDLLEFGTNQGWNSSDWRWYYNNNDFMRWHDLLTLAADNDLTVLPYFEYAGSVGPDGYGSTFPCAPLSSTLESYTHIWWSERYCVDVSDPAALTDVLRLIDETLTLYADQNDFLGAWFRTRPSHIPMSFADATLRRFESATGRGSESVTRTTLAASATELSDYKEWWYGARKDFLLAIRDHLQTHVGDDAVVLYTADHSEAGHSIGPFVTDDVESVTDRLSAVGRNDALVDFATTVADDVYRTSQLSETFTWGGWEWNHSIPPPDPSRYASTEDVLMTYSMSKTYTVSSSGAFDDFRTPTGLAAIRHYELNEAAAVGPIGYFVSDVEPAGPFSMRIEALAMANGDLRYLGYLSGHNWNHGFPELARRFYANFLALPAVPSTVVDAASHPDVVVRRFETSDHGTYFGVIHTGLIETTVTLTLDAPGMASHLPTGGVFGPTAAGVEVTLAPYELLAIHVP